METTISSISLVGSSLIFIVLMVIILLLCAGETGKKSKITKKPKKGHLVKSNSLQYKAARPSYQQVNARISNAVSYNADGRVCSRSLSTSAIPINIQEEVSPPDDVTIDILGCNGQNYIIQSHSQSQVSLVSTSYSSANESRNSLNRPGGNTEDPMLGGRGSGPSLKNVQSSGIMLFTTDGEGNSGLTVDRTSNVSVTSISCNKMDLLLSKDNRLEKQLQCNDWLAEQNDQELGHNHITVNPLCGIRQSATYFMPEIKQHNLTEHTPLPALSSAAVDSSIMSVLENMTKSNCVQNIEQKQRSKVKKSTRGKENVAPKTDVNKGPSTDFISMQNHINQTHKQSQILADDLNMTSSMFKLFRPGELIRTASKLSSNSNSDSICENLAPNGERKAEVETSNSLNQFAEHRVLMLKNSSIEIPIQFYIGDGSTSNSSQSCKSTSAQGTIMTEFYYGRRRKISAEFSLEKSSVQPLSYTFYSDQRNKSAANFPDIGIKNVDIYAKKVDKNSDSDDDCLSTHSLVHIQSIPSNNEFFQDDLRRCTLLQ